MNPVVEAISDEQLKESVPSFNIGDLVDVHVRIKEGEKERIQVFTGWVIGIKGAGATRMFTVRRLVAGEGVERTFPLHSPNVVDVHVLKRHVIRRSKLYWLRNIVGKVKLKEKIGHQTVKKARRRKRGRKKRATAETAKQ